jgi:hypothetical protein
MPNKHINGLSPNVGWATRYVPASKQNWARWLGRHRPNPFNGTVRDRTLLLLEPGTVTNVHRRHRERSLLLLDCVQVDSALLSGSHQLTLSFEHISFAQVNSSPESPPVIPKIFWSSSDITREAGKYNLTAQIVERPSRLGSAVQRGGEQRYIDRTVKEICDHNPRPASALQQPVTGPSHDIRCRRV